MAVLKVGDHVPDIAALTADGQQFKLADRLGKNGFVIFFYPKDGTPICTREACAFRDAYDKFVDAGVEVIGVSGDSDNSHQSFADQHHLKFPLISDSNGLLRKAFGVPKSLGLFPGRMTFVVDRSGVIRLAYSAMLASDEHVQQALTAVQAMDGQ